MNYSESAIAATMEDSEALGFRFDPLSGDHCGSSGERRPRAFVRLDGVLWWSPRARVGDQEHATLIWKQTPVQIPCAVAITTKHHQPQRVF